MDDCVSYFLSFFYFYFFVFLAVVWDQGFYCIFCSSKPHFTRTQVSHLKSSQQVLFWTIFLLFFSFSYLSPSQTSLRFPSVDLASLLPKAGVDVGGSMDSDLGVIVDGPSAEDLGQSLVFTNSHHNGRTATHSYAHATANSYAHAASGGTTYAHSALVLFAPHTHTFYVTTSIFPISVFSSSFDFIHSSSPQFWALVLGPWIHPSQHLPLTWGHQSSSVGLDLHRELIRRWTPPATIVFPKMQEHLQYRTLFLPALPL